MSKHRYQTKKVNEVDWEKVGVQADSREIVFAVDVAKEKFVGALMCAPREILVIIKWKHPEQTGELLETLEKGLVSIPWSAAMEPTGTYGDSLRHQLIKRGIEVHRVSPKGIHDAAELYDGVPSLHDAKAAWLIGALHWQGLSQPWPPVSATRREHQALVNRLDYLKARQQRCANRMEALLSRHWPEGPSLLGLESTSLLSLIAAYGDPASIAANEGQARELIQQAGKSFLSQEKIDQLLDSARFTLGVPCLEEERALLQSLAQDQLQTHAQILEQERRIREQVKQDTPTRNQAEVIGAASSAVLNANVGSALDYANPASYLKSLGLNLKERSSGELKGYLALTKRGSAVARRYLYFAALRLIRDDPIVRAWYRRKINRDGGLKQKAIIAVMRKLGKALWHVARGEPFDAGRLFDVARLDLA